MQIRIQSWEEINQENLAKFIIETRQREGAPTDPATIETFRNYIERMSQRPESVPIVAYSNHHIVGWLVLFSFIPKVATIGRWHPTVKPGSQPEIIAARLLEASINHAQAQGFERFEAELTEITPSTELRAQQYQRWLEAQGMYLVVEEARFERKLTPTSVPVVHLPPNFELMPLAKFTNEELRDPFFEMFNNSMDRFWLDQPAEQRLTAYNFWFDRERPFIDQASSVLVKGPEIVGVTVVRPIREVGMLGPIGVIPQYRRQGLGCGLLAFSMQGALASGFSTVQLEVDITNEPACALYQTMGFQHVNGLRIFALTL